MKYVCTLPTGPGCANNMCIYFNVELKQIIVCDHLAKQIKVAEE